MRVVLRVVRSRHLDPGELFGSGAIFIHVAHGAQGIGIGDCAAIDNLKRIIRHIHTPGTRRGAGGHRFGARAPGQRDQRDIALAKRNRFHRMADMHHIRTATHIGGIEVLELRQPQIIRHIEGPKPRRGAGAEKPVHIILGKPRILQRAIGDFSMQLGHGCIIGLAGRVLKGTHDIALAIGTHEWRLSSSILMAGWKQRRGGLSPPRRSEKPVQRGAAITGTAMPSPSRGRRAPARRSSASAARIWRAVSSCVRLETRSFNSAWPRAISASTVW